MLYKVVVVVTSVLPPDPVCAGVKPPTKLVPFLYVSG